MITIKITKEDDTVACEVRQNAKAGDLALELVSPGRAFAQMTRQFVNCFLAEKKEAANA